jgi:hypothetical protein
MICYKHMGCFLYFLRFMARGAAVRQIQPMDVARKEAGSFSLGV